MVDLWKCTNARDVPSHLEIRLLMYADWTHTDLALPNIFAFVRRG